MIHALTFPAGRDVMPPTFGVDILRLGRVGEDEMADFLELEE